ncbi:hypothetical protein ABB02_01169 [Clostridiaceae bacterium JG1575]|nr:hypothetical protein ABB02_01169 [Clostridiaceae bacterium JG1575]
MNNEISGEFHHNLWRAFLGALLGAFIGSVPLFFFEFRDGAIPLPGVFLVGLLVCLGVRVFKVRINGIKELLLMILAVLLVYAVYEAFIRMLYLYEAGLPTTLNNLRVALFKGSGPLLTSLNLLTRTVPALILILLYGIIFIHPPADEKAPQESPAAPLAKEITQEPIRKKSTLGSSH